MINSFKVQLLIVGVCAFSDDPTTNLTQVDAERSRSTYGPAKDPYVNYYNNVRRVYPTKPAEDPYADFDYDRNDSDTSSPAYHEPSTPSYSSSSTYEPSSPSYHEPSSPSYHEPSAPSESSHDEP